MTPEQEQAVVKFVKENPTILKALVLPTVVPELQFSTTKLYTLLRGKGIRKWRGRKRPPLDTEVAAKRLAWAIKRKDWAAEGFEGVIWSDECTVEKGKTASTVWCFVQLARSISQSVWYPKGMLLCQYHQIIYRINIKSRT